MRGIQGEIMEGLRGAAWGGIGGQAGICQAVGMDGSLRGANADGTALQHLQGHHSKNGGLLGDIDTEQCWWLPANIVRRRPA